MDIWAFERFIGAAESAISREGYTEKSIRMVSKAIQRYHGPFLSEDTGKSWSSHPREKLRSKFLRHLVGLGCYWEKRGEHEKAIGCFQKGIEADSLAEEIYQHLITCYMNLDRRSEAIAVYHRCKRVLSSEPGLHPSHKTEALYKKLILR